MTEVARKDDAGKDPWHLVPWDAVRGIVKVLEFGSRKYAPRNWEKGLDYSRVYSALMRHMTSWWEREKGDSDTGYSHLWHAGCCVLFLIALEMRGKGVDDRPTLVPPEYVPEAGDDLLSFDFQPDNIAGYYRCIVHRHYHHQEYVAEYRIQDGRVSYVGGAPLSVNQTLLLDRAFRHWMETRMAKS